MPDEPNGKADHSQGLLLLRFIKGRLRLFRIRNLADALNRGGPFE
jgi:hypothetical protein